MIMTVSIDLMPYEVTPSGKNTFRMELPWDIKVPSRYRSAGKMGLPCLIRGDHCTFRLEQDVDDRTTTIEVVDPDKLPDNQDILDDLTAAIGYKFDAFQELGWEALEREKL